MGGFLYMLRHGPIVGAVIETGDGPFNGHTRGQLFKEAIGLG